MTLILFILGGDIDPLQPVDRDGDLNPVAVSIDQSCYRFLGGQVAAGLNIFADDHGVEGRKYNGALQIEFGQGQPGLSGLICRLSFEQVWLA